MQWSQWLQDRLPAWLETLNYQSNGIGDLDDLKFQIRIGSGKWYGFVNHGWYYYNGLEQYNYVVPNLTVVPSGAVSGIVTEPVSFRPSWGPVIVLANDNYPYTEIVPTTRMAVPLNWSLYSANIYRADLPSGAVLIGLRGLDPIPKGQVDNISLLTEPTYYYLDRNASQVYVYSTSPTPSGVEAFADLAYGRPNTKIRELVVVQKGKALASYRNIENLTVSRGYTTASVSGVVDGEFDVPLNVTDGEWVVLEYDVRRSFVLLDHNKLYYYRGQGLETEPLYVYNETSVPDMVPVAELESGLPLEFHPLSRNSLDSGFLFHAESEPSSGFWKAGDIYCQLDSLTYVADWGETPLLVARIGDAVGLPIPYASGTVSITLNGSSLALQPILCDAKGMYYRTFDLPATGSITAVVMSGSASASSFATATHSTTCFPTQERITHGRVAAAAESNPNGESRVTIQFTDLSGLPSSYWVACFTKLGSVFEDEAGRYGSYKFPVPCLLTGNNPTSIARIRMTNPAPDDGLLFRTSYTVSNILKVSG